MNLQNFKKLPLNSVIRVVTEYYDQDGELLPNGITYVVKTRNGYHDWCIYSGDDFRSIEWIKAHGKKVMSHVIIERIFPCTDDVMNLYAY